jgi:hypothetical protein
LHGGRIFFSARRQLQAVQDDMEKFVIWLYAVLLTYKCVGTAGPEKNTARHALMFL